MYIIRFNRIAEKDLKRLRRGESILLNKVKELIEEIKITPYEGKGKPEQLLHNYAGRWSRRISKKHRLVYLVEEEAMRVTIEKCYGHYDDK